MKKTIHMHALMPACLLCIFFLTGMVMPGQCLGSPEKVYSTGLAKIFNNNVERARRSAVRQAYSEAVGKGAGMEIGSMTVVKNFQLVSDILTSRSNGFINDFTIVEEGLSEKYDSHYFVTIEAEVSKGNVSDLNSRKGLRAYLDLLENPAIIIFLTESEFSIKEIGKKPNVSGSGGLRAAETQLAQALMEYGYRTITSDEILAEGYVDENELKKARMGSTAYLVKVARIVGADVIINGMIRIDHKQISPAGVPLEMVGADFTSKTILASAKRKVKMMHITERKSHPEVTEAYTEALNSLTTRLSESIAWDLPKILAKEHRQTDLSVRNVDISTCQKIQNALSGDPKIESVKLVHLPTKNNNQMADMTLYTGFIRLSSAELVSICTKHIENGFNLLEETKYAIKLEAR